MKPFLMGTECEYSVSGRANVAPLATDGIYSLLADGVRKERRWMQDIIGDRGMYLEHGGRLYLDSGFHPEYATPECHTPTQIAAYDKAGEFILDLARQRVQRDHPGHQLTIVKNNLDPIYPDGVTFGCHESYTSWVRPNVAARALVPHLVSRIIYAGSGCLSSRPLAQGFELSQRARHLVQVVGDDTTTARPIFCTRVRKSSDRSDDGWTRAHLIGKDSQRAPFGIYLTFATTGLLFLILNRGSKVGKRLKLRDPVQALNAISCDPWLKVKVPLMDNRELTALEIQESYLEECAAEVHSGGYPDWATDAVRHWGETLAALRKDPLSCADRLDPYCKLLIYRHELDRAGYRWTDLFHGLQKLAVLRHNYDLFVFRAVVEGDPSRLNTDAQGHYARAVSEIGADGPGIRDLLRFTQRMQALDLSYHEIGGLYDWLGAMGKMRDVVLTPGDVERASREAPAGGRAALRSAVIRAQPQANWVCDWQYAYDYDTGTCVDLRDPFGGEEKRVHLQWPVEAERRYGILEMLAMSTAG